MIRVVLPTHLRKLARVAGEVTLTVPAPVTQRAIRLKTIADGAEKVVTVPAQNPKLAWIGFSPNGARFAFTHTRDTGIELWVGDTATGQAKAITTAQLNASLGAPCSWVTDGS